MFNPNKSAEVQKKELRYPPTRVGLAAVTNEIKGFVEIVKRLPLGEQTFSSDISHRREMFRKYLGYIVSGDPRGDVQKSVGYGAALEIRMIQELENILNHSDDNFAEKAEIIVELNPSGFSKIKDEFDSALAALTGVIDSEESEFIDIVDPFNRVNDIITTLFTCEIQDVFGSRKQVDVNAINELQSLMGLI